MVERGDGLRLKQVGIDNGPVSQVRCMRHLDGDLPAELVVDAQVNGPEASLTEPAFDPIPADLRRDIGAATGGRLVGGPAACRALPFGIAKAIDGLPELFELVGADGRLPLDQHVDGQVNPAVVGVEPLPELFVNESLPCHGQPDWRSDGTAWKHNAMHGPDGDQLRTAASGAAGATAVFRINFSPNSRRDSALQ
jgi:hypothetical protein